MKRTKEKVQVTLKCRDKKKKLRAFAEDWDGDGLYERLIKYQKKSIEVFEVRNNAPKLVYVITNAGNKKLKYSGEKEFYVSQVQSEVEADSERIYNIPLDEIMEDVSSGKADFIFENPSPLRLKVAEDLPHKDKYIEAMNLGYQIGLKCLRDLGTSQAAVIHSKLIAVAESEIDFIVASNRKFEGSYFYFWKREYSACPTSRACASLPGAEDFPLVGVNGKYPWDYTPHMAFHELLHTCDPNFHHNHEPDRVIECTACCFGQDDYIGTIAVSRSRRADACKICANGDVNDVEPDGNGLNSRLWFALPGRITPSFKKFCDLMKGSDGKIKALPDAKYFAGVENHIDEMIMMGDNSRYVRSTLVPPTRALPADPECSLSINQLQLVKQIVKTRGKGGFYELWRKYPSLTFRDIALINPAESKLI